ncbi:MAG: hypothetical protein WKF92_00405 [Pyrinomonadaceae bacterium]
MAKSKAETLYDSAEQRSLTIAGFTTGSLSVEDLANPADVTMLIQGHQVTITDLQSSKAESALLRSTVATLTETNTELRVRVALAEQRQQILWIEIPVSFLMGIAANLLTQTPPNMLGWIIIIVCVLILLFLRVNDLVRVARKTLKGNTNGDQ